MFFARNSQYQIIDRVHLLTKVTVHPPLNHNIVQLLVRYLVLLVRDTGTIYLTTDGVDATHEKLINQSLAALSQNPEQRVRHGS